MEKSLILALFSSLFGNTITLLKTIIIAMLIIGVIWLCIRIPQLIPVVATSLAVVIVVLGVFAAKESYTYLTAKNLTIGEVLQSAFNNKSEIENDEDNPLAWDMKNIGFEYEGNSTYSTTIEKPHNEAVDLIKYNYVLYINNEQCYVNETGNEYVKSEFKYTFYDSRNEVIKEDILYINFGFYQKQTIITISTEGGEQAVDLWKSFQVKNGFKFELKPVAKGLRGQVITRIINTDVTFVDNPKEDTFTVNIYLNKKLDTLRPGLSYIGKQQTIDANKIELNRLSGHSVGWDLHMYYKSSSETYNFYTGDFNVREYRFLDIGDKVNDSNPATEENEGMFFLGNKNSTDMSIMKVSETYTIDLRDYVGINPTGKILNIYIDLVEVDN